MNQLIDLRATCGWGARGTMNQSSRGLPLKLALIVPFLAISLLGVGLAGYLSFRNSRAAINDVADQLRQETTLRIAEHIQTFLHLPQLLIRLNADALARGALDPEDPAAMERSFWEQIDAFDSVTSLSFGNTRGGLVNSGRELPQDSRYVIVTENFTAGPFLKYATDSAGRRAELLTSLPDFDARTRGWYRAAEEQGRPVWSDIYILFTGQDMAIAASRPVYDSRGELLGVVAADIFLAQLSRFLQELQIGASGHAFIVDSAGMLVACSTPEQIFVPGAGETRPRRLLATETGHPAMRTAAEALEERFGHVRNISTAAQLEFTLDEERHFLQVTPLQDQHGVDWLIVVEIPEADFMARIEANNRGTLVLTVLTLLLVSGLGVVLAQRVTRPILRLNTAAGLLARGESPRPIEVDDALSEVAQLTRSFNHMAQELRSTLDGLNHEILERKEAEAALRQSEEHLAATLRSIGDGVISTDADGRVTGLNIVAEDLTGWSAAEALGHPITEVFRIKDSLTSTPAPCPVRQALNENRVIQLANHTLLLSRDGQERQIADTCAPIHDAQQQIVGAVLVFRDVTGEYAIRQALQESEGRLSKVLRAVNDGIFDWDVVQGTTFFDDKYYAMLGYAPNEFPGTFQAWKERVHPEDLGRALHEVKRHLAGETQTYQIEFRFRRKDGGYTWILGRGQIVERDAQGRPIRMVGTHTDITARKQAETRLKEAERRYREIFENAPVAIFQAIPEGRFLAVNPAYARIAGYGSPREMIDQVHDIARQLYHDPEERQEYLRLLREHGKVEAFEAQLRRKDGTLFWASMDTRAVRDEAGNLVSLDGFLRDVTAHKQLEEERRRIHEHLEQQVVMRTRELKQANERLVELDKLKTSFLSSASHELRTPLTSIIGFAKISLKTFQKHFMGEAAQHPLKARKAGTIETNLEVIATEGERLGRLVNDLLDINKIESGAGEWRDAPFPPSQALHEALQTMAGQFSQKPQLRLVSEIPPDLPLVVMDRDKLLQVVINLLNNAHKFTEKGQVGLSAAQIEGKILEIKVRDSGPGIPEHDLERIFEMFYQSQAPGQERSSSKGTGLGLAICRRIVEHYGGRIWAESEPGRGATFVVHLPVIPG